MRTWWRRKAHKAPTSGSVIASAALISRSSREIKSLHKGQDWQDDAWGYYDVVTELHTGANWLANACSRARLYAGIPDENGEGEPDPTDNTKVQDVLEQFFNGPTGQSEMLRRVTLHLTIPGESYICGWNGPEGAEWRAVTQKELKTSGKNLSIIPALGAKPIDLEEADSQIFRIWRPHGNHSLLADSPTRSVLPLLRELRGYDAHIAAVTQSRLATAGLIVSSNEITGTSPGAGEGTDPTQNPTIQDFYEAGSAAVGDDESPNRILPSWITVPAGEVENFKFLSLSTPYDERVKDLREAVIRRLAVGMDMPLEILLGIGNTNHWNAWAIDESAIKLHIEPMLSLICAAITEQYLRPMLEGVVDDPDQFVVHYDASELVQRPNRGPEAERLYVLGELSSQTLLRENGFSTDDAPSKEERDRFLLTKLLLAQPEYAPQILPALGISGVQDQVMAPRVGEGEDRVEIETVNTQDTQRNEPPDEPVVASSQVVAYREDRTSELVEWQLTVAEMAALRALERAGQWLINRVGRQYKGRLKHIPITEMHEIIPTSDPPFDDMLRGAFDSLEQALPESPCIRSAVDGYVRGLIVGKRKHERQKLAQVLASAGCIGGCGG